MNLFSVMVESARIARGAVKPLTELSPDDADAVVIPGGFGAAKNLSDFGFKVTLTINHFVMCNLKAFSGSRHECQL